MSEQSRKEDEDEFLSRLSSFRQNVSRYFYTLFYVWLKPKYLVQKPDQVPVEFSEATKKPMSPVYFLASTYLLIGAAEKIAFPTSSSYELPPQLVLIQKLIDFLPSGSTLLLVLATVISALVPYAFMKISKNPIPFNILFRAFSYQQAAFLPPVALLIAVASAFYPSMTYHSWMKNLTFVLIPISLYSLHWLSRQLKYEGYFGTVAVWLGILIPGFLYSVARDYAIWPTKSYNVPSGSMLPTLAHGDLLVANTWVYHWRNPQYGELVVFRLPKDPDTVYIKRLIGLPGDRVQMIDGILNLNERPVRRERISDFAYKPPGEDEMRVTRYRETFPNGISHETIDLIDNGFYDNTKQYVVPHNHYFLMGDNRDNSTDSRVLSAVGYVPFANLVGVIYRRILPPNRPLKVLMPD
ncbi:MAG: signal peptidase [Bradyrhizobium sp.]|jgi:signal peptidase I|nr:signal peptidase [Bradyrhizobium sp.]